MPVITSSVLYGVEPGAHARREITGFSTGLRGVKYPIVSKVKEASGRVGKQKILSVDTGVTLSKSNIIQFIRTDKGQRVMRPNFGLGLKKYLFEAMDGSMFNDISNEIIKDIRNYFPHVFINNISVIENTKNLDAHAININLTVTDTRIGSGSYSLGVKVR